MFESFLANKYTAAKRFGLEGCEALIPGMKVRPAPLHSTASPAVLGWAGLGCAVLGSGGVPVLFCGPGAGVRLAARKDAPRPQPPSPHRPAPPRPAPPRRRQALIDRSADMGVESVVIGMPHRGAWAVARRPLRGPAQLRAPVPARFPPPPLPLSASPCPASCPPRPPQRAGQRDAQAHGAGAGPSRRRGAGCCVLPLPAGRRAGGQAGGQGMCDECQPAAPCTSCLLARPFHARPLLTTRPSTRPPPCQVFSEFAGRKPVKAAVPGDPDTYMGSGDVKYHLGTSYDRPTISGAPPAGLGCSQGQRPVRAPAQPCAVLKQSAGCRSGSRSWRRARAVAAAQRRSLRPLGQRCSPQRAPHLQPRAEGCCAGGCRADGVCRPPPSRPSPRRQAHPPEPAGQPLAPGGRQHGGHGQGGCCWRAPSRVCRRLFDEE